jgi:hypothetical protein
MSNRTTVTVTFPGNVLDCVKQPNGNTNVIMEIRTEDSPIFQSDSIEALTRGMSEIDAEVLLERISHFALTESLRARIRMGGITTHTSSIKGPSLL